MSVSLLHKWRGTALALAFGFIATAGQASPQRPIVAGAATPQKFDPKSYADSIAGINCANVATRARSVVPIEKALRGVASRYSTYSPFKGEFETTEAFEQRVHNEVATALGGTDRIVAVIPIRDMMHYDADASTMTIDPVSRWVKPRVATVLAYSDLQENGRYVGRNAYGASTEVTRETFTQFYLMLPARGVTTIRKAIAPDVAQSIKENGSLVIVGGLLAPYFVGERSYSAATISDPSATTYLSFYLTVMPECAMVINGDQIIGRIGL